MLLQSQIWKKTYTKRGKKNTLTVPDKCTCHNVYDFLKSHPNFFNFYYSISKNLCKDSSNKIKIYIFFQDDTIMLKRISTYFQILT